MILGSHNSWSYLSVRKWWMKPIAWIARCQSVDIRKQYKIGVRCFDLRIRYNEDGLVLAHGIVEYDYSIGELFQDLEWLNEKGDVQIRILHEVRKRFGWNGQHIQRFASDCIRFEDYCNNIKWWCGRNLYNWEIDYRFDYDPSCDEKYGSVSKVKLLYGWWPWLYAMVHNKKIYAQGTDKEILLIDYVIFKSKTYEEYR